MTDNPLKPQCEETYEEIWAYLDGELTEAKRAKIRTHLDECPPCEGAEHFEAELRLVISQRCRDEVPEALKLRIYEALRRAGGS
ncbi:MAG: mycothiol system anti-sigma-R factor [Acidimicrobiales bacterium]|nr:mycothiol system anti-sigma-R factor [Acidimicrobiales bacterium]MCB1016516.1 mycothiol system anti-sigma-R factor [Acidimicrobiales bacterium]MCB9371731.1 mycothiol system anti-sigma-R factor [Microthrixaceae bacterium]